MRWTGFLVVWLGWIALAVKFIKDKENKVLEVGEEQFVLCVEKREAFAGRRE